MAAIAAFFKALFQPQKQSPEKEPPFETTNLTWMKIARQEIGQKEIEGVQDNPRIVEYHKATDLGESDDETPWCSSFVNWVFMQCGMKRTKDAMARSWLNWGFPMDKPDYGCIVVFWRDNPEGYKGHVGFYTGVDSNGDLLVLGGNQDNQVKIKAYSKNQVLGYRWPIVEIKSQVSILSWERNHPERIYWSKHLRELILAKFNLFDSTSDFIKFRPDYYSLNKDQRVSVWSEFFCWLIYYECAWNPKSNSVDVGNKEERDTHSVGLLQLSVIDQESYNLHMGYNFTDLQDPIKNLNLGLAIFAKQLEKKRKVLIPVGESGLYWATLHPGGKYDKTSEIADKVKVFRV